MNLSSLQMKKLRLRNLAEVRAELRLGGQCGSLTPPCPGAEHPKDLGCDRSPLTNEELVQWARGRPGPELRALGSQSQVPLITGRMADCGILHSQPPLGGRTPLLLSHLKDVSLNIFLHVLSAN